MNEYIIIYYGGDESKDPEDQKAIMQEWNDWLTDLGDAVVNPGTLLASLKMVTSKGVTNGQESPPLNGYSIVKAENINEAIKMVEICPHLKINGTIKVAECMSMT